MALKSSMDAASEKAVEIEERLEALARLIDRLKVMYEQYFMGIQKVAPSQLHRDAERGIRELTQIKFKNTAMRFRFATLSQKFGSYNTYWRRIMREIEQGRYIRDISRVKRKAERTGQEIPEEILNAMPKLMRDRVRRDREKLAARKERLAEREGGRDAHSEADNEPAVIRDAKPHAHRLDESLLDDDFDFDKMFADIQTGEPAAPPPPPKPAEAPAPAAPTQAAKPAAQRSAPTAARPRPASPPIPAARPRPAPAPAPKPVAKSGPGGMSEKQTRELFNRYVQAKKLVGDDTDKLSYDRLVKTLEKQAPRIMKQHKAKGVDFNVVLKDDKVILKAKPRK